MKKHLVLIAFIMAGTVVFAQDKGRGHQRDVTEEMRKELPLSDDQYSRIKAIDESYRAHLHDLRIDSARTKEEKMKSMRSLGDARRKEIDGVLTQQQRDDWSKRQTARREEHRAHSQQVGEDRALKLKKDLGLSNTQFTKFQDANKTFREKASHLRQEANSDESKKDAVKKLRADYDKSMKSILTKDQYKKWSDMKSDQKKKHHDHHGAPKHDGGGRS